MNKIKDIAGRRFGKLIAISFVELKKHHATWLCKCDCGDEIVVDGGNLRSGRQTACGCVRRTPIGSFSKWPRKTRFHGGCGTKLYTTWEAMRQRCRNKNNSEFKRYGAKGIDICKKWDNFNEFRKWANQNGYKEGLRIHRKNRLTGYSPKNCEWLTIAEHNIKDHLGRKYNK